MAFEWSNTSLTYIPPNYLVEVAMDDETLIEMKFIKPKPKVQKPEPKPADKIKVVDKLPIDIDTVITLNPDITKEDFPPVEDTDFVDTYIAEVLPVGWAQQMPEYPGGERKLYEYLSKKIKFTDEARSRHISGTVSVSFIVETNGSITGVKTLNSLGYGLDENALEAIEGMKNWSPGRQGTENVRVKMTIPITYKLRR
jgi:protein TonB